MQGRRNRLFEMDNEKKIKLATWNIRTMLQVGKMMEIAEELQKWERDINCNTRSEMERKWQNK